MVNLFAGLIAYTLQIKEIIIKITRLEKRELMPI
ncbi:MAG: hypothetical protein CENE_00867 [Candidatus Celerinatantimonas neptuna]|nr:MAG: hypothetical protein CENE_00867 [Candidatus Celerinatantimonas neptuna]